jgi:hypothetical protein
MIGAVGSCANNAMNSHSGSLPSSRYVSRPKVFEACFGPA